MRPILTVSRMKVGVADEPDWENSGGEKAIEKGENEY